ncbi:hypothetical protein DSO57_1010037 [Entomophthora muscae]|uniref:Uncharacterized protein n=1 Tax=Entomophthora muscae TaxID=34485 RepID=A0ACC2RXK8_9FUNG|nr:hypothetical protein DSO57_1010037 [Entomophthora muscae]
MALLKLVILTLDIVSAASALVVIYSYFLIKKYNHVAVDRVSIRLQLGIAFIDLFKHFMACISIDWGETMCSVVGFLNTTLLHIYMCLNVAIALNLHLVILGSKRPHQRMELFYWILSVAFPLIFDISLLVSDIFGSNGAGKCGIKNNSEINDAILLSSTIIFMIGTMYCLLVSILVLYKVKREKHDPSTENLIHVSDSKGTPTLKSLSSLICRTCLYPISYFLAYLGSNFGNLYYFISKASPTPILYWGRFGYSSRGILHLISFFADPLINKSVPIILKGKRIHHEELYLGTPSPECDLNYDYFYSSSVDISLTPGFKQTLRDFQKYI